MKVLVLLSRIPWPLDKGDKLRAYRHVVELARHHRVYLCCLSDEEPTGETLAHLRSKVHHLEIFRLNKLGLIWQLFMAVIGSKPFQVHYFYRNTIARAIKQLLHQWKPEHVYCQLVRTAEYVKHYHDCPKTLDYMDAFSAGIQRRALRSNVGWKWFWRSEAQRLLHYEHIVFEYFEHHTIISEQDRQLIYHPKRQTITVVPNGVDTDFFQSTGIGKSCDIVFTGNMSYPPNVQGAVRIVNRVLPLLPEGTRVLIAGADPTKEVVALQSNYVTVSGRLPDIRPAYDQACVFLAPMELGAGMQNKILEAMSMRLPCIVSPLAARALHTTSEHAFIIAETDEQFAHSIIRLLSNGQEREALGDAARRFVVQHYSWENNTQPLLDIVLRG
jgi:polysaccharide biosynthesis protein PslH